MSPIHSGGPAFKIWFMMSTSYTHLLSFLLFPFFVMFVFLWIPTSISDKNWHFFRCKKKKLKLITDLPNTSMYCKLRTLKSMFTQKKGPYCEQYGRLRYLQYTKRSSKTKSHLFLYVHSHKNQSISQFLKKVTV